jgi:hypothetical protein
VSAHGARESGGKKAKLDPEMRGLIFGWIAAELKIQTPKIRTRDK